MAPFLGTIPWLTAEGLVVSGVVAIDGTKIEADASAWSNRTRRQLAAEVLIEPFNLKLPSELRQSVEARREKVLAD